MRVARLKELLAPLCGGKCQVVIDYRNHLGQVQLPLGDEWRVSLHEDLLRRLRELLGEQAVRVVYA
jgi:DNA polymerase-3 subunit alpha